MSAPGTPVRGAAPEAAYRREEASAGALRLDGNEGARTPWRRYPDTRPLEEQLAARWSVDPSRVLVTAGGDDLIDRACRAWLGANRRLLLPVPSFEMIERYARLAGATIEPVPWRGAFPVEALVERAGDDVGLVPVVSPNNPNGAVATLSDLRAVSLAFPRALVLLDHAYVEYAEEDLTRDALGLPNVVVLRTFSKAWGLAGCRVGYGLGSPEVLDRLRAAGAPYAVSAPSIEAVRERLATGAADVARHVARVRRERDGLAARAARLGLVAPPSKANFLYFETGARTGFLHAGLRALGVVVRRLGPGAGQPEALRVTLPGDPGEFARLARALETVFAPEALLFDLDGVLADVTESQGPGLRERERLLVPAGLLGRLARRLPLAVVTGRPRDEAETFLERQGVRDLFSVVTCREDAPLKPNPAPVRLTLDRLGVTRAFLVGDTPDDVRAALAAGVLPLAFCPTAPGSKDALLRAGAAVALASADELTGVLS
jgi:histidinol-phosphate aminotransferase